MLSLGDELTLEDLSLSLPERPVKEHRGSLRDFLRGLGNEYAMNLLHLSGVALGRSSGKGRHRWVVAGLPLFLRAWVSACSFARGLVDWAAGGVDCLTSGLRASRALAETALRPGIWAHDATPSLDAHEAWSSGLLEYAASR